MENYFHIETIDRDNLLVIILSYEMTSVYWKELQETLRGNHIVDKTVYFDFFYRNGSENRYFISHVDNHSKLSGQLKKCCTINSLEAISTQFFEEHKELLPTFMEY